ncbi:MAG: FAD-binding oxidoreductase [Pseudomonadota bacterium]
MASAPRAPTPPARIHWHRTATDAPVCEALRGAHTADVVVIGGGLTGTRTALGLAEDGASVALLEAREIGFGASGRSGGQCNPMWRQTPDELAAILGDDVAARLVETTIGAADALFEDISRYGIACDAEQNGWVQAAHSASARRSIGRLAEAWSAAGADIRVLEGAEVHTATGSMAYDFALKHAKGGSVQPLSLTRGFARAAQRFGARLFEQSPVRAIERDGAGWRVRSDQGSVTAPRIILTTNGYTDDLWPRLRQTFYPMVSIILATAPLSGTLQKSVLPGAVTISDSRRAIYYARYDRHRRLVFGCMGSKEDPAVLGGVARLKRGLRTVFPQLSDTPVEACWGGTIAVTPKMMPHLHEPAPGILAGLGFSGRGIAMTSVMARTLLRRALGAAEETLPFPVTPIEPVPLHGLTTRALPLLAPVAALRDRLDRR